MQRIRLIASLLVVLHGCSDFDCPDGQARIEGMCRPAEDGAANPEPKSRWIGLACRNSLPNNDEYDWSQLFWELTVDPGPIPSADSFGARFKAFAGFNIYFLNVAQNNPLLAGARRVNFLDLRATVHVRRGADDPDPVPLELTPESIPWTCRYDRNGNEENLEDDFPPCSPDNDHPDFSNSDCVGLGGDRHPENRCGQFKIIPTSTDCVADCDTQGDPFPQLDLSPGGLCRANGFCVTDAVEVELFGETSARGYVAADSGYVLFGWDDVTTGATLDESNGPDQGTWKLPPAVFTEQPGPNGLRTRIRGLEIAMECTMGISSWSAFTDGTLVQRSIPTPDHLLISFPIQEP